MGAPIEAYVTTAKGIALGALGKKQEAQQAYEIEDAQKAGEPIPVLAT
jgi:hypothetical protein